MSEVVAVDTAPESLDTDASSESVEAPATPAVDETTWKRRLQGKDQALTATQKERDALRAELDQLSRWKAERETADLSEVEKLQRERDLLRQEAAQAKAEATAAKLSVAYPLAAELLGGDLTKFDEARVAEINGRLAKEQADESTPEPRNDPNSPRRPIAKAPTGSLAESMKALEGLGNPFFDEDA